MFPQFSWATLQPMKVSALQLTTSPRHCPMELKRLPISVLIKTRPLMMKTAHNAMMSAYSTALAPPWSFSKVIGLRTANAIGSAYMANVSKAMSRSPKASTNAQLKILLMSDLSLLTSGHGPFSLRSVSRRGADLEQ